MSVLSRRRPPARNLLAAESIVPAERAEKSAMSCRVCVFAAGVALALGIGGGIVPRSAPAAAAGVENLDTPKLELTAEQRHVLFTSVTSMTHVSTAAPPGFMPKTGDTVPEGVEMLAVPDAVVKLIPKLADYRCALVANQVLIVEPQSRRIVDIVAEGTAPPMPARS
jgi:hypothetical protein